MQPKALILLAAALQSANILAAPVASPAGTYTLSFLPSTYPYPNNVLTLLVDAGALAFNNPGYYREYRVATESGLVDKEKRDEKVQTYGKLYLGAKHAAEEKEKRTSWTLDPNVVDDDKDKEKRQIGFHTASYAHLYKDAADEGLAEEKAKEKRQTEFRGAAYVRVYKEAADKGLVERDAEKE